MEQISEKNLREVISMQWQVAKKHTKKLVVEEEESEEVVEIMDKAEAEEEEEEEEDYNDTKEEEVEDEEVEVPAQPAQHVLQQEQEELIARNRRMDEYIGSFTRTKFPYPCQMIFYGLPHILVVYSIRTLLPIFCFRKISINNQA